MQVCNWRGDGGRPCTPGHAAKLAATAAARGRASERAPACAHAMGVVARQSPARDSNTGVRTAWGGSQGQGGKRGELAQQDSRARSRAEAQERGSLGG